MLSTGQKMISCASVEPVPCERRCSSRTAGGSVMPLDERGVTMLTAVREQRLP